MDEWEWVTAAKNRQTVILASGDRATLLSWGTAKGRNRARVEFGNGRQRTVPKGQITRLTG